MSNSIIKAFKSLNVTNSEDQDHANIYEISYQYLSKVKHFNDIKSFNNCLVALINLDKYYQALELINKVKHEDLIQQFSIEVGYVYYKTRQSKKLQQLYNDINNKSHESSKFLIRGLKHILAQDYYQTGENGMALELYHELIKSNEQIDNLLDLSTNELAIISQTTTSDVDMTESISKPAEASHDLLFNEALIALKSHQLNQALDILNKALELLDDLNLDSESYELEKCPILLIKSYIYQSQQKTTEAKQILQDLQLNKFNDLLLSLIINNNYYSFDELVSEDGQYQDNINLIHRALNYQQSLDKLSSKLSFHQYNTLIKNNLLLKYLSNTLSKSSHFLMTNNLNAFMAKGDYSLLTFKVLVKLGVKNDDMIFNPRLVSRKVYKVISSTTLNPDTFRELSVCTLILLSLNTKTETFHQSLIALEKLVEYNLSNTSTTGLLPALIGSLIRLYEKLNSSDKLLALYAKLFEMMEAVLSDTNPIYYNFFKTLGFRLLSANEEEGCFKVFKVLNQKNPQDGLVSSILNNDYKSEILAPIDSLISNVDDDIINTDIECLIQTQTPINPIITKASTVKKVEKKKLRKPKFGATKVIKPADQVNLDEERWLPMRLRSYYKPKKSKKKAPTHQGSIESPSTSQASTPAPPAPSASKKANKKKKKGKK